NVGPGSGYLLPHGEPDASRGDGPGTSVLRSCLTLFRGAGYMRALVRGKPRLSWSEKLARLAVRLRDPEWRRYGKLVLVGKLGGAGLVVLGALIVGHLRSGTVYADDA